MGISDLQLRFIFGGNLDRDQIRELFDEIERLREELGLANGEAEDYKDEMNRLAQRVERLEKALNLYGDKVNWVETYDGDSYFISMDAKDMWDYDNRPWDIALEALEPSNV